mgnify:CR=1 FL=1
MLGVLWFVGKGRRRSPGTPARGRKSARPRGPMVEAVEQVCHAIEAAVPDALLPAVVVELLEDRTHLTTTFNAFISGAATGTHGQNFAVNLWTTGQQATQWVVTWGDNNRNTYTAPPGGFPVPYQVTHQYATAQHYTITATGP